jgi:hypothetical protein
MMVLSTSMLIVEGVRKAKKWINDGVVNTFSKEDGTTSPPKGSSTKHC